MAARDASYARYQGASNGSIVDRDAPILRVNRFVVRDSPFRLLAKLKLSDMENRVLTTAKRSRLAFRSELRIYRQGPNAPELLRIRRDNALFEVEPSLAVHD